MGSEVGARYGADGTHRDGGRHVHVFAGQDEVEAHTHALAADRQLEAVLPCGASVLLASLPRLTLASVRTS